MGFFITDQAGDLPAGYTEPTISGLILANMRGIKHLYIADYASLDTGAIRWVDLVTGVEATPYQPVQFHPQMVQDGAGRPALKGTGTYGGSSCGFNPNQPLGLTDAYTIYSIANFQADQSNGFILGAADGKGVRSYWTDNSSGNLHAVNRANGTDAVSANDIAAQGAIGLSMAGWNAARGSVQFARNGGALSAPVVLADAIEVGASPVLMAADQAVSASFNSLFYMIAIFNVDHSKDDYIADRALVAALARDAYGF